MALLQRVGTGPESSALRLRVMASKGVRSVSGWILADCGAPVQSGPHSQTLHRAVTAQVYGLWGGFFINSSVCGVLGMRRLRCMPEV